MKLFRFTLPPSSPENSLALAPYLDLLNHHPDAVVEAGVSLNPAAPPGFQIVTRKAIKKGDQVPDQGKPIHITQFECRFSSTTAPTATSHC